MENDNKDLSVTEANNIAMEAYRANRAYCKALGDIRPMWGDADPQTRKSMVTGVFDIYTGKTLSEEDGHNAWMKAKLSDGWKLGPTSLDDKTHDCLVPYNELPQHQKIKDTMFRTIVMEHLKKRQGKQTDRNNVSSLFETDPDSKDMQDLLSKQFPYDTIEPQEYPYTNVTCAWLINPEKQFSCLIAVRPRQDNMLFASISGLARLQGSHRKEQWYFGVDCDAEANTLVEWLQHAKYWMDMKNSLEQ